MSGLELLEAALGAAEAGWSVFPCREAGPRAKSPYTAHGHLDASQDADQIRARWTRWPNALIGAAVPELVLVIDIDPRNGGTIETLEAAAGPMPVTLTSWSGREDGGRHLYFLRPPGALTSTRMPPGVDLKVNGYVILPPSLHPATGRPYRWELAPIAPAPWRLRELLRSTPPRLAPTRSIDGSPLVRLVAGLTDGERNRGLFWAACRAAEAGLLSSLEDELLAAAQATGLDEREARRVIASAVRVTGAVR